VWKFNTFGPRPHDRAYTKRGGLGTHRECSPITPTRPARTREGNKKGELDEMPRLFCRQTRHNLIMKNKTSSSPRHDRHGPATAKLLSAEGAKIIARDATRDIRRRSTRTARLLLSVRLRRSAPPSRSEANQKACDHLTARSSMRHCHVYPLIRNRRNTLMLQHQCARPFFNSVAVPLLGNPSAVVSVRPSGFHRHSW